MILMVNFLEHGFFNILLETTNDPTTAGLCNFLPSSKPLLPSSSPAFYLSSNSDYWLLILTTGGSFADSLELSYTSTVNATASDEWSITGNTAFGQVGIPMFSINVTPVPEPSVIALLVMAMAVYSATITFGKLANIIWRVSVNREKLTRSNNYCG